ncbi:MAG: ABC-2 family transporter protein [Deinococcales bacterium]
MARPNLNKLPEYIRLGDLDFFLLKPVSAQFMVSCRYISLWDSVEIFLGLALILIGMARNGSLNFANLALGLIMFVLGLIILYSIWLILISSAFWFVRVNNITEIFWGLFMAGRFPAKAFPLWVRFMITVIMPIIFVTTLPASAAIGRLSLGMLTLSLSIAILLFYLSHRFWRFALSNYTSASS